MENKIETKSNKAIKDFKWYIDRTRHWIRNVATVKALKRMADDWNKEAIDFIKDSSTIRDEDKVILYGYLTDHHLFEIELINRIDDLENDTFVEEN